MGRMGRSRERVTLEEIARLSGTTKSTVSRVLSHHPRISEATRRKVLAVVRKKGYQPNLVARGLARGRTGLIGVLSSNIGSGFYADVIRGIDLVATEQDRRLLCTFAHTAEDYAELLREMVMGGQVDGVIALAPYSGVYKQAPGDAVPVVLCASRPPRGADRWKRCPHVVFDNRAAMRSLLDHLYEAGHRDFVHLAGPDDNFDAVARKQAFRQLLRRRKDAAGRVCAAGLIREDGFRAGERYLKTHEDLPDVFVAVNDSVAVGFLEALRACGGRRKWPAAITGWDDTPLAEAYGVTSVEIPSHELGRTAARGLLDLLEGMHSAEKADANKVVEMSLIIRESSRRSRR